MPRRETESKVKYKSASDLPPAMMARDITWSEAWPEVEINTGPGQVSNRPLSLSLCPGGEFRFAFVLLYLHFYLSFFFYFFFLPLLFCVSLGTNFCLA